MKGLILMLLISVSGSASSYVFAADITGQGPVGEQSAHVLSVMHTITYNDKGNSGDNGGGSSNGGPGPGTERR